MNHLQELQREISKKQDSMKSLTETNDADKMTASRTDRQIQSFVRWANDIISARGLEIETFPQDLKSGMPSSIFLILQTILTQSPN